MKGNDRKPTTNGAGIPVSSDEHSLTVGPDGPILLQDHYLIEQMANFNREQIPVNRPKAPVHSYSKGGSMRVENTTDPVYAPNSKGGPQADPDRYPEAAVWSADGDFIRAAYTLRKEDEDDCL